MMFKPPAKIKPGDVQLRSVRITAFCILSIDQIQLLKIFNDSGYSSLGALITQSPELIERIFNVVDTSEFTLNYNLEKKMLELTSNEDNFLKSFEKVLDLISNSDYNILNNILFYEFEWRIQDIKSEKWSEILKEINLSNIEDLTNAFGGEELVPISITLGNDKEATDTDWSSVEINPSYVLGKDRYRIRLILRNRNLEIFRDRISNLGIKIEQILLR